MQKVGTYVSTFPLCPGTELNRYPHCCRQDFKSCVSTNSTTRAVDFNDKSTSQIAPHALKLKPSLGYRVPKGLEPIEPKKNPPPKRQEELLSGRPGSNRPPRPWQGRALPNELLPQLTFNTKER